jgi:hypothetical protein
VNKASREKIARRPLKKNYQDITKKELYDPNNNMVAYAQVTFNKPSDMVKKLS